MDGFEHFVVAACLVVVLAIYVPHYLALGSQELFLLYGSVIFFCAVLTPDVDLKIPFLAHRGATHNPLAVLVIAALAWLGTSLALAHFGQASLAAFMPFLWSGFAIGWLLHLATDYCYDRIRQVTWVVLGVLMAAAWYFAGK